MKNMALVLHNGILWVTCTITNIKALKHKLHHNEVPYSCNHQQHQPKTKTEKQIRFSFVLLAVCWRPQNDNINACKRGHFVTSFSHFHRLFGDGENKHKPSALGIVGNDSENKPRMLRSEQTTSIDERRTPRSPTRFPIPRPRKTLTYKRCEMSNRPKAM
jgi:hypothetical protein